MIKHPIATTKNGVAVYVDLIKSPASANISWQPHIATLAKELLQAIDITADRSTIEFNVGRTVGNCSIVETTAKDHILYAKRVNHDTYCRFVRRRAPEQTSYVTLVLKRDSDGEYELYDAWLGHNAPAIPGTEDETKQSKAYWENHALVVEGQPIQNRTLTTVCPY